MIRFASGVVAIGVMAIGVGCAHSSDGAAKTQTAPQAASAPEASPCKLVEADGGFEYTCGSTRGIALQVAGPANAALDHYQTELEHGLKGKGTVRGEPARLEDLDASGRRVIIDWRDPHMQQSEGYVWALEGETKDVILISCVAEQGNVTLAACHQALIDLKATLVARSSARPGEVTLLGKTLPTPAGCSLEHDGDMSTLTCANATLGWWTLSGRMNRETLDQVASKLASTVKVIRTESPPCSILGQAAMCRRQTAEVSGKRFFTYFGLTEHEGNLMLVMCSWPGDPASLPAPCGQVFGARAAR